MKKTFSFCLEKDIMDTILDYKEKYKLSSNSSALERIIVEYRLICNQNFSNMQIEKQTEDTGEKLNEEKDFFSKIMKDAINTMPD